MRKGFQLIEIVIGAGILAVSLGAVISISVTSSRGMRRSGDLLVAISLAQLTMDKVLSKPFFKIQPCGWKPFHDDKTIGPGEEFLRFETMPPLTETSVNKEYLPGLYRQFQNLDYQYKIDVDALSTSSDLLSVLITVRWQNSGNTYDYKLTGYRAKAI